MASESSSSERERFSAALKQLKAELAHRVGAARVVDGDEDDATSCERVPQSDYAKETSGTAVAASAARLSDRSLVRFISARKLNCERAMKLIDGFLELFPRHGFLPPHLDEGEASSDVTEGGDRDPHWTFAPLVATESPKHYPTLDEVRQELATQKMYLTDRGSFPEGEAATIVWRAGLHVPGDQHVNTSLLSFSYVLAKALEQNEALPEHGDENASAVACVMDCEGFGWANFDFEAEKIFTSAFSQRYPVRFKAMLLVDAPWYMNVIIAMLKPFLSAKLRNRIVSINRDQLPEYGLAEDLPMRVDVTQQLEQDAAQGSASDWFLRLWR